MRFIVGVLTWALELVWKDDKSRYCEHEWSTMTYPQRCLDCWEAKDKQA